MRTAASPIEIERSGRETSAHGTPEFPCECDLYDPSTGDYPWHWHDHLEFVYAKSGSFVYAIGDQRFLLREGDAAFVNVGVLHSVQSYLRTSAREHGIVFLPSLMCDNHDSALWRNYLGKVVASPALPGLVLRHSGPAWHNEVIGLVSQAYEAVSLGEELFELTARECLTRACVLMWQHELRGGNDTRQASAIIKPGTRVKTMIGFMEAHLAEHITVSDIAGSAHVGQRQCQREFKAVIGDTPIEYLMQLRLRRSVELLRDPDMSVAQVAASCGFSGQSYYAKVFSEAYGKTPSRYRRELLG